MINSWLLYEEVLSTASYLSWSIKKRKHDRMPAREREREKERKQREFRPYLFLFCQGQFIPIHSNSFRFIPIHSSHCTLPFVFFGIFSTAISISFPLGFSGDSFCNALQYFRVNDCNNCAAFSNWIMRLLVRTKQFASSYRPFLRFFWDSFVRIPAGHTTFRLSKRFSMQTSNYLISSFV